MGTNDENFFSFTDILDDDIEIPDSQPMSPVSNESQFWGTTVINENSTRKTLPENPIRNDNPRNIEEIDPKYRNVFAHANFNAVQTKVIDDALFSNKSMVVCAPTGSGKTVIFEMAIVQLLMEREQNNYAGDFKIIYMAPVKSLCTERSTDWYAKFSRLGLKCIEVTGDHDLDFDELKLYSLIITTPEKWDILTRRWRAHREFVEVIKLFLIDEVHILNDETRGPVLEAVVSRMKTIESSAEYLYRSKQALIEQGIALKIGTPPKIRFVAVSATIGNPEDVAAWLGTKDMPAINYKFGDEYRPVKINRIVEGYYCANGTSTFKFDIILNYKLGPLIKKYSDRKPTLVFCNTRKGVILTAETLCRTLTLDFTLEQKAKLNVLASVFKNKQLQNFILKGVGCHHAGLLYEERTNIERAFKDRELPLLITTTTLAMGVNLPAHLVIIKNTKQYVKGAYEDYSISSILQMVGRAGRPQFDTEATAVIMTSMKDKPRYQALVGGSEPLQSFLHKRVPENLNSEIALETVRDLAQCVEWLQSTFLYVRAAADPRKYLGLPNTASANHISNKITELCVKAKNGLESAGLIKVDSAGCIKSTDAGRFMSLYYMDLQTMKHIMKINGTETIEQLLDIVCSSHELSDMYLRVDEKRILNSLNRSKSNATIRFPIEGKINTREKKLSCIIQAVLGSLSIHDPSLYQESMKIMKIAERVCNCLVAYVTRSDFTSNQPQHFSALLNSIVLAKCIIANMWENSIYLTKQLKGIGPTYSSLLAISGKVKFSILERSHPRDLERIMNKGPPVGNDIQKQISLLPKYQIQMKHLDDNTISLQILLLNHVYLSENIASWTAGNNHKAYIVVGDTNNNLLLFTSFNDRDLIKLHGESTVYQIKRKVIWEHKILIHCISSNYVGLDVHEAYLFKNLYPECRDTNENNDYYGNNVKKTTHTQFTKKRSNSDDKIELSREKKKRNNSLINKVMSLKRPLYSNPIFIDPIENNKSENQHNDNNYESPMREEVTKKNVDGFDDENEQQHLQPTKRQITHNAISNYKQKKFKFTKKKNNYAFIDLLEKNMDLDDSEDNSDGNQVLNDEKEENIFRTMEKKIDSCKNSNVTQIQQNEPVQIPQTTLTFDEMVNLKNISENNKLTQSFEKSESTNNTDAGQHVNSTKNEEISNTINNNVGEYLQKTKCNSGTTLENMTIIVASAGQDEISCSSEKPSRDKDDELRQEIVNVGTEKNETVSENLQLTKTNNNSMNNNEILHDEKIEKTIRFTEENNLQKDNYKNIISTQTSQVIALPNEIEKVKPINDHDLTHTINCSNRFNESQDVNKNNNNEYWNDERIEMIIRATEKNDFVIDNYNYITSSQIQQTPKAITFPHEVEKNKQTNHSLQRNDGLYQIQNILKSKVINAEDNNTNVDTKHNDKKQENVNDIVINLCNKSNLDLSNKKDNDSDHLHPNWINFEEKVNKTLSAQNNEVPKDYSTKEVIVESNNSSLNRVLDQCIFEKALIPGSVMKNNTIYASKLKKDVIKEKHDYNKGSVQNAPEPSYSRNNSAQYSTNKYERPKIIPSIFRSYYNKRTSEGRSCDDKIESIIKYSFSNISTRVTQNDNVCIIQKTKIDLGVTEIMKRIDVKKTNEGRNISIVNTKENGIGDKNTYKNPYPMAKVCSTQVQREKIIGNDNKQRNEVQNLFKPQNINTKKVNDFATVETTNCGKEETKIKKNVQNNNTTSVSLDTEKENKLPKTRIKNVLEKNRELFRNNWTSQKVTNNYSSDIHTPPKSSKTSVKLNKIEPQIKQKNRDFTQCGPEIPLPKMLRSAEAHRLSNFTNERKSFVEHKDTEENLMVVNEDLNPGVGAIDDDSLNSLGSSMDEPNMHDGREWMNLNKDYELRMDEIDPEMFNPQTLLRINNGSENVMQTKPDFSEEFSELNFPVQPLAENFTNFSHMCQYKVPTHGEIEARIYGESNAFDRHLDSTPTRLRQRNESIESIYNTHFQNSTEYRPNQSFHCPAIDAARRQAKLNKFQYVAKNKMKLQL